MDSMVVESDGYNGKLPGFPSAKKVFSKYAEGRNSKLKPALPINFSGTGLSKKHLFLHPYLLQ